MTRTPYGNELKLLPTILVALDRKSYLHDKKNYLKIETPTKRVWLSETGMVTEEAWFDHSGWVTVQRYNLQDITTELAKLRTSSLEVFGIQDSPGKKNSVCRKLDAILRHLEDCPSCSEYVLRRLRVRRSTKDKRTDHHLAS